MRDEWENILFSSHLVCLIQENIPQMEDFCLYPDNIVAVLTRQDYGIITASKNNCQPSKLPQLKLHYNIVL